MFENERRAPYGFALGICGLIYALKIGRQFKVVGCLNCLQIMITGLPLLTLKL